MSQPGPQTTEITYRGNTFVYSLPNGWSFRLIFAADGGSMRMEATEGEFAGQALEFDIAAARVSEGVYFVNWIKPDGGVVSHVHDYHNQTVQAYWSYDQDGKRVGQLATGTIIPAG